MGQFRSQLAHSSWGPASVTTQWKDFPERKQKKHKRNYLPTYLPYYARDEVRTNPNYNNQQQQYSYSQQQQEQQQKDEKIL